MNLTDDCVLEIPLYLDAVSISRFLCSSKRLWSLRTSLNDKIVPYEKYVKYKQWNKGLIEATKRRNIPQVYYFEEKGADNFPFALKEAITIQNGFLIQHFMNLVKNDSMESLQPCGIAAGQTGNQQLVDMFLQFAQRLQEKPGESFEEEKVDLDMTHQFALMGACQGGHLHIVEYILSKQVLDPNDGDYPAMQIAAKNGHKDVIDLLIKHGVTQWDLGLVGAAEGGHMDLLQFFWDQGAKKSYWALEVASEAGHLNAVNWLLEKANRVDWGLMLQSASRGGHKKLVEFFIAKGGDSSMAAVYSIIEGNIDLVQYFLELGFKEYDDYLSCAARNGHLETAKLMVEKGATDFNQALQAASVDDHREIIEYLIEQGANSWDKALETAASNGHRGLAEMLIDKGATNAQDSLDFACHNRHKGFAEMLVQRGLVTIEEAIQRAYEYCHPTVAEYLARRSGKPDHLKLIQPPHPIPTKPPFPPEFRKCFL